MSILDRKPAKYSTSDLFWEPAAAPSDGVVGDVNTMRLDPAHLSMMQDMIVDTNGVLRSRGAVTAISTDTFASITHVGAIQLTTGTGLMSHDAATTASFLYGTSAQALTGFAKLTASGYASTNAQQLGGVQTFVYNMTRLTGDTGAAICGQQAFWVNGGGCNTFLWGGNATVVSDTTAGTAASTVGSTAIVGVGTSWTSALIGCYLFIGAGSAAKYVGQVDAVSSTTALTLKKGALFTIAAAAPSFKTARQTSYNVYKGRVTATTGSTTVIGANTKWLNSFIPVNNAIMFRASDGAYVGTVSAALPTNDTTLLLTANAAISMTNEEYYLHPASGILVSALPSFTFAATCCEFFADRFWYGGIVANNAITSANPENTGAAGTAQCAFIGSNSIAFSKKNQPEMLDLDQANGDIITLPSSAHPDFIRGLYATRGGLLVFRYHDVFLITGYSPETFRAIKICDDGTNNCLSIKGYNNGVVWAGSNTVWYFDGTNVINLLQNKTQRLYKRTIKVASNAGPVGLGISNDHVLVSYAMFSSGDVVWPYKNTTRNMSLLTTTINMTNGAIGFFTNMYVTSSFSPKPTSGGAPYTNVLMCRSVAGTNGTSYLLNGNKLFEDSATGADNFDAFTTCATFTAVTQIGPDCMFETVKFSLGNAARLKFWKMFMLNYSSDVSMTATIIGTNDTTLDTPSRSTGIVAVSTFPVSSNVGVLKRIKFLVRSPTLSIRVYQTATTSATSQRFKVFWFAVGGKWMRWGRQQ